MTSERMTPERLAILQGYRALFREDWQLGAEALDGERMGGPFVDAMDEIDELRFQLNLVSGENGRLWGATTLADNHAYATIIERDEARRVAEQYRYLYERTLHNKAQLSRLPWESMDDLSEEEIEYLKPARTEPIPESVMDAFYARLRQSHTMLNSLNPEWKEATE